MATILPRIPSWDEQLATGLGAGLQQLAQQRMQDLQRSTLSQLFQQGGYSPQEADILAHLGFMDPKGIPALLKLLGAGSGGGTTTTGTVPRGVSGSAAPISFMGQPGEQIDEEEITETPDRITAQRELIEEPSIVSPEKKKKDTFAEKISKGVKAGKTPKEQDKQKSVTQQKHEDAIISTRDNLNEIVEISDNLLERLNKGVRTGIISSGLGKVSPTLLDENTEGFFKDASRLLDLQSEDIKGRPSIYRIKIRERAKPGLEHSETINRDIISKIKKEAQSKLGNLNKRYKSIFDELEGPDFKETVTEKISTPGELKVGQKLSQDEALKRENAIVRKGGKTYVVKNGKLVPKE